MKNKYTRLLKTSRKSVRQNNQVSTLLPLALFFNFCNLIYAQHEIIILLPFIMCTLYVTLPRGCNEDLVDVYYI